MKIIFFKIFLITIVLLGKTYAGIPVWSFVPLTPTNITIDNTQIKTIGYQIINQSHTTHALVWRPIMGIKQLAVTPESCSYAHKMGYLDTCILTLQVDGSLLTRNIHEGPVLCEAGNPLECYQANPGNRIDITLVTAPPAQTFTVGGVISGLISNVVLQNGSEILSTSTDGSFVFPNQDTTGTPYNVTINTQPPGQTCTIANGSGVVTTSNVTNIQVTCSTQTYTVAGTLSGLSGTVVLQNNGNLVSVTSPNNTFTFPPQANGSSYSVTIQTQPAGQVCNVANGNGTISGANVTNVSVVCSSSTFTVGGTLGGLSPGNTIVLGNYGGSPLSLTANGSFTFPNPFPNGSLYSITVLTQPVAQFCTVTNGSGVVSGSNVTNISVSCSTQTTTITFPANAVIPVGGTLTFPVFNSGNFAATNVHAVLPGGWTDVTQDATNCAVLPSSGTCNLLFTSATQPYVAQAGIPVVGDNVVAPLATTALAFSINNFLVVSVDSSTNATITNAPALFDLPWGSIVVPGAVSLTDGAANTAAILAASGPGLNAAQGCDATLPTGTWYLPAICQMGSENQTAGCPPGLPNVDRNLFQLGFLPNLDATRCWSSTEVGDGGDAWTEIYHINNFSVQAGLAKFASTSGYCLSSVVY